MLTDDARKRVFDYLSLSIGLFLSVQFSAASTEYHIRNGFSRLYYAFFHVSLGFLTSQGEDIDVFRKDHGMVQAAVKRRMGKYMDRFIHDLYRARLQADYEPLFFHSKYGGDLERARTDALKTLERASKNFYWIYWETRKVL